MINDYNSWYQQNIDLIDNLSINNSILYHRIKDVIDVMDYISSLQPEEINDDLQIFHDTGFTYLYNRILEINYYLHKYFNNNFSTFIKYDRIVDYSLYIDELKDVLKDSKCYNQTINKELINIELSIENILSKKEEYNDDTIDNYNIALMSVVPMDKQLFTIPEIFSRAVEELQI